MLPPLPPDNLPVIRLTIPEIAAAKAAGYLRIHDNGVLTLHRPGESPQEIWTPIKVRRRKDMNGHDPAFPLDVKDR